MLNEQDKTKVMKAGVVLLSILCVYFIAKIGTEFRSYGSIGTDHPAQNTITVSGEGEEFAVPDVAQIRFTARAEAKTMTEAQSKMNAATAKALEFVKSQGIDDKDIKTESYGSYPKYEWQTGRTVCTIDGYCPPAAGRQVLVGYEASQTVLVKVRSVDNAGAIVDGLGAAGASEISGPNFVIDDSDSLMDSARKAAIDDAKEKARVLARDLGVRLVRIVSFNEGSSGRLMYEMANQRAMDALGAAPASATLPTGEQKIVSTVTITYEIR